MLILDDMFLCPTLDPLRAPLHTLFIIPLNCSLETVQVGCR